MHNDGNDDKKKDEGVAGTDQDHDDAQDRELHTHTRRQRTHRRQDFAGAVTRERRRLQAERKGMLTEIIMQAARERSTSAHRDYFEDDIDLDQHPLQGGRASPGQKASPHRSPSPPRANLDQTGRKKGAKPPSEGKKIVYATHIERFHRNMIRKEIWQQKFDFLYRQIQLETEQEEEAEAAVTEEPGATGSSKLASQSKASRRSDFFNARQKRAFAALETEAAQGARANEVEKDDRPNSQEKWQFTRVGPPRPSSSSRPHSQLSATSLGTGRPLSGTSVGSGRGRGRAQVITTSHHPTIQASSSLPSLSAQHDLRDVRDEYYEGDDLFMHEDILHSTNPRLFPLRAGSGKPFPLPSLLAC